jgi:hypothetical protein
MEPPPRCSYFPSNPDIWIPVPNTPYQLPLTWKHALAIQRVARFCAKLRAKAQQSEGNRGLENYESWMITLFQIDASIRQGITPRGSMFMVRIG